MPTHHHRDEDEADRVREDVIDDLRDRLDQRDTLIGAIVAVMLLGALAAILGGPAAVQALQAVQGWLP